MSYLMILGRLEKLGLAELESCFGAPAVTPLPGAALLEATPVIASLGGTQKIARIIAKTAATDDPLAHLDLASLPTQAGKQTFGLSLYGTWPHELQPEAVGLALKRRLKTELGGNWRFVAPKRPAKTLTTAQVKHQLAGGFELIIMNAGSDCYIAITEQIQDIDWYSKRDYERPARSAKVGMLPPKLAQILINLAGPGPIYDPFCGTGVILQEALLMGRAASGSDIEPAMVEATTTNLQWLTKLKPAADLPWAVRVADAQTVSNLPGGSVIASEGYLGPNLTKPPTESELAELQQSLGELYVSSLRNLVSRIDTGAGVAICLPAWKVAKGYQPLQIVDLITDLGYTLTQFVHVNQSDLLYFRPDQMVARRLLILRKS